MSVSVAVQCSVVRGIIGVGGQVMFGSFSLISHHHPPPPHTPLLITGIFDYFPHVGNAAHSTPPPTLQHPFSYFSYWYLSLSPFCLLEMLLPTTPLSTLLVTDDFESFPLVGDDPPPPLPSVLVADVFESFWPIESAAHITSSKYHAVV